MIARRLRVTGRVQGVGFRFFALRAAEESGIRGWVRNLPDGSVESVAEGDEGAVGLYVQRLREGPRSGRVADVLVEERAFEGFDSFEITR